MLRSIQPDSVLHHQTPRDKLELICGNLLRAWLKQADIDEGKIQGLTSEERDELRRLRQENKVLKQERDFLKKA
jgi:transposase-like protein